METEKAERLKKEISEILMNCVRAHNNIVKNMKGILNEETKGQINW